MPPNDVVPLFALNTTPSHLRPRSYSGGYMDAGKVGEAICFDYLEAHPGIILIDDVRSDPRWQDLDVDFRVFREDLKWMSVEAKYDSHLDQTGNWLFELYRVNHSAPIDRLFVAGWSVRSAAEHLLAYAPCTHRIHSIRMRDYRRACANAMRLKAGRYEAIQTDAIKTTVNFYFSETFVQSMQSYKVFDADTFELVK